MKVVVEYRSKKILEKYNNKYYVRFYGGKEENDICEFPITKEQVDNAVTDPSLIKEYVRQEQGKLLWERETFLKIGIVEYIVNGTDLGMNYHHASHAYYKISKHEDIKREFYNYIMNEEFPAKKPINIEGYTAESLVATMGLNPFEAYRYLVYLREDFDNALSYLKAGAPEKYKRAFKLLDHKQE